MSQQPEPAGPVPVETVRVARAAFPKGNVYMPMRGVLGALYDDASFRSLFAVRGRPAESPWRLALVTVMQFAEGLSDRQAAEGVRARIDWKYALGLELTDPGFDFSVLSEYRARLIGGAAGRYLLDALLAARRARGLLRARGRQRTDSTHVLGALRLLSRLEQAAETPRAALSAVAADAPDWRRTNAPPDWFERYGRRVEEYRLPRGDEARQEYAALVGADGMRLLEAIDGPAAPPTLRLLPAVEGLRRTWVQQYVTLAGVLRLREPKNLPPASARVESPYEPEARYGTKRDRSWIGYKVHLSESCDDDRPHLLTHVETTVAPASDVEPLAAVHRGLAGRDLLPGEHLVDAGYVRGPTLIASRREHRVDLVGPIYEDRQWKAKAQQGSDAARFRVIGTPGRPSAPRASRAFVGARRRRRAAGPSSRSASPPPTAWRARPGPSAPAPRPGRATSPCSHGLSTRQSRRCASASRRPSSPPGMRPAPASKARPRTDSGPSARGRPAIAAWPRPTSSTSPPRPPSTSSASPTG
jgi:transposase